MKQHTKKLVILLLVAIFVLSTVVFAACVNKDNSIDGTYYYWNYDRLDKTQYFILKNGRWTNEADESGEYEIKGTSITLYIEFFGSKEEYFGGTVKDGALVLSGLGTMYFYKEGSAPKTGTILPNTSDNGSKKTVTVKVNGGEDIEPKQFTVGEVMADLPTPIREGYRFVVWQDSNGVEYTTASVMPDKDLTLIAQWEKIVSSYKDQYVSFKPASEGWKSEIAKELFNDEVDKAVYVEITSDDIGGVSRVGQENNFTLRTMDSMEYAVKSGYTWSWFQGGFNNPNGAQRFTLNYGSNIQLITISDNSGVVVQTYLLDIYVRYDYYVELYEGLTVTEPYTTIRIIENELFSEDTPVFQTPFEFDARVYYNSKSGKYENYVYSTPVRSDVKLYQTYKTYSISLDYNNGNEVEQVEVTPYTQLTLTVPQKQGYDFLGWKTSDGKMFTDIEGNSGTHYLSKSNYNLKFTAFYEYKEFYYHVEDISESRQEGKKWIFEETYPLIEYTDASKSTIKNVTYKDTKEHILAESNLVKYNTIFKIDASDFAIRKLGYDAATLRKNNLSLAEYVYDATITSAVTFTVIREVASEMSNFTFESDEENCKIISIIDKTVEEIIVPDYVTEIEGGAFSGCGNLTSIELPFVGGKTEARIVSQTTLFGYIFGKYSYGGSTEIVQQYVENSFSSSVVYYVPTSLTKVVINSNILAYSFNSCKNLVSVVISDNVTTIGNYTFTNCSSLTNLTIGNNVTYIGGAAFRYCSSLESITVPSKVTSVGFNAFADCSNLTTVYWNTTYCERVAQADKIFSNSENVKTVVFGENVQIIPSYVLYDCIGVTSIVIPESVTRIGENAFYGCSNLLNVTIGKNVTHIGVGAFCHCSSLASITIPASVSFIGRNAFYASGVKSVIVENPIGWWYSADSNATSGTSISVETMSDPSSVAFDLKSGLGLSGYNWYRSES